VSVRRDRAGVDKAADIASRLEKKPAMGMVVIRATLQPGVNHVLHGLQRPFLAAWVAGKTSTLGVVTVPPEEAAAVTDIKKYVVATNTGASPVTVQVVVI